MPRRRPTGKETSGRAAWPIQAIGWRHSLRCLGLVLLATILGCSVPGAGHAESTPVPSNIRLPPAVGVFDYQLGGAYERLADGTKIDIVVRDATSATLEGAYNICYVNGFQTQPGDAELWQAEPDLLLKDDSGEPVVDPEWPDEYILDPSTTDQRTGILAMIEPMITRCAESGFDAVEIDNLDTWTRFERIDRVGAFALAKAYVALAHGLGLAIAQKNTAEIAPIARHEFGFDFAISEECAAWAECSVFTEAYGDHVLQIEYPDSLANARIRFVDVCTLPDRAPLTILRDRDLTPVGHPEYIYRSC